MANDPTLVRVCTLLPKCFDSLEEQGLKFVGPKFLDGFGDLEQAIYSNNNGTFYIERQYKKSFSPLEVFVENETAAVNFELLKKAIQLLQLVKTDIIRLNENIKIPGVTSWKVMDDPAYEAICIKTFPTKDEATKFIDQSGEYYWILPNLEEVDF